MIGSVVVEQVSIQYDAKKRPQIVLTVAETSQYEAVGLVHSVNAGEKKKPLRAIFDWVRKRRSLDANAYLWVLLEKIAQAVGSDRVSVYRQIIHRVGKYEIVPVRNDAVESWIEAWTRQGEGWQAEILSESKIPGYKNIACFFGSSVYDSREMARVIDEVVGECKSLGIETLPSGEIESLIGQWGQK